MRLLLIKIDVENGEGANYHAVKDSYLALLKRRFKLNEEDAALTAVYNSMWGQSSSGTITVKQDYFEDLDGYHYSIARVQDISENDLLVLEKYIYVNRV